MNELDLWRRVKELEERLAILEAQDSAAGLFYDDLMPLPVNAFPGIASPPSVTAYLGGSLAAYEFVNTATKAYLPSWQLTHAWDEGTAIYPHLHLFIPAGTTGVVKFTMTYTWINIDGVEGSGDTIYGTVEITDGTYNCGNKLLILDSAAIDPTGKTISSILQTRIARDPADAADTFGASVWLKSVDIHTRRDGMGSRGEYTK